jgi:hypothetical protein
VLAPDAANAGGIPLQAPNNVHAATHQTALVVKDPQVSVGGKTMTGDRAS